MSKLGTNNGLFPSSFSSYLLFPADPSEIVNISNLLHSKKISGHGEITVDIMKKRIQYTYIAEPLAKSFIASFETSVMPDALKIVKVCPIYKEECKTDFPN